MGKEVSRKETFGLCVAIGSLVSEAGDAGLFLFEILVG